MHCGMEREVEAEAIILLAHPGYYLPIYRKIDLYACEQKVGFDI